MDDEVEIIDPLSVPQRHTKWSFIVLGVDLVANLAREVSDTLETATTLLSQHRLHKIEEDDFFEVVKGE